MATTVGGEVGGLVGSQVLPAVWDNPYAGIVGGIGGAIVGGGTGALIREAPYIRLANAFNNSIKTTPLKTTLISQVPGTAREFVVGLDSKLPLPNAGKAFSYDRTKVPENYNMQNQRTPNLVEHRNYAREFAQSHGYYPPFTPEQIKTMYRMH
jgi:hypothetical protein